MVNISLSKAAWHAMVIKLLSEELYQPILDKAIASIILSRWLICKTCPHRNKSGSYSGKPTQIAYYTSDGLRMIWMQAKKKGKEE